MTERLRTPLTHTLNVSPLGALMDTPFFERLQDRSLPLELRLMRAGAAAGATVGEGVDAFLEALGGPTDVAPSLRDRLKGALAAFAADWRACSEAVEAWEEAFWGRADASTEECVEREKRRRAAAERCVFPVYTLGFLAYRGFAPPVERATPAPASTLDRWSEAIRAPERLYAAPETLPLVEGSRAVPGPAGVEYFIRFPSPSPLFDDDVYARVFEPQGEGRALPTLIYGSGFAMAYDQVRYWPEEEYMGRALAAQGYRVVLVESPWHGRRTAAGCFSGEPYLATAPEGMFRVYAAQAQETARLVAWARAQGAPVVGVGGVSLGGMVAQQVAGWCGTWPEAMRPDVALLVATSAHIDEVVLEGTITRVLDVDDSVRAAGWTPERLRQLRPLLDPPDTLGLAPENVVAVLGRRDRYVPYRWARAMLDGWNVPEANVVTWDVDHVGVLVRLCRETDAQELVMSALDRARAGR